MGVLGAPIDSTSRVKSAILDTRGKYESSGLPWWLSRGDSMTARVNGSYARVAKVKSFNDQGETDE